MTAYPSWPESMISKGGETMSEKDIRLQQDAGAIIHDLEKSIVHIKAACLEPDINKACGLFATELATIIARCAVMLGADIHTGESF